MHDGSVEAMEGEVEEAYEPPAIVVLGSVAKLTSVEDGSLHDESDRLLKQDIQPLRDTLERLRAIRTRRGLE